VLSLVQNSFASDAYTEANHRIANHLSIVASILRLEQEAVLRTPTLTPERAYAVLEECGRRIEAIARIHQLLSQRDPLRPSVELGEYLRETAENILSGVSAFGRNRLRFVCPEPLPTRAEDAVPLGLIVGELVTNAVKYAHPSGVRGAICVSCQREADGATVVAVCDDGVGLPEGFDPHSGRDSVGFRLILALAQRMRAKVEFENSCLGLSVTIRVP